MATRSQTQTTASAVEAHSSQPSPHTATFTLFLKLPVELQVIIFKEATAEWMLEELRRDAASALPGDAGAILAVNKDRVEWIEDGRGDNEPGRHVRECDMPTEMDRMVKPLSAVLPSTLWVNRLARDVAYDTLIHQAYLYPPDHVPLPNA